MDQCLCVGGAESLLAMNHCKIPNIYWKYWNCFENLEFLIPPVGRETWWVKSWRQQWWRRRERKEVPWLCSCAVFVLTQQQLLQGREDGPCQAALAQLETGRSMPQAPIAWFWGAFLYFFAVWKKKKKAESETPFQTGSLKHFGTNPGHPRQREAMAESTREKSNASYSAQTNLLACWPITSCGTDTITITTAFFPKEIHILFHYLSIEMTLYKFSFEFLSCI